MYHNYDTQTYQKRSEVNKMQRKYMRMNVQLSKESETKTLYGYVSKEDEHYTIQTDKSSYTWHKRFITSMNKCNIGDDQ